MTYATVDYDDGTPYVARRPKGLVVLHGPGGPHGSIWSAIALVDTGADRLHLPTQAAHAVGVSLTPARRVRLVTAGGTLTMDQIDVEVDIQGIRVTIPANFGQNAEPLIGREAIFAAMVSVGFTTSEWLVDWY